MRYIIVVISLVMMVYGYSSKVNRYFETLKHINSEQKSLLLYSISAGYSHNLGYTLAAIAFKESMLGKYNMNLNDGIQYRFKGSYGPYHNLLNSVCDRKGIKGYWSASRIAERLLKDKTYASKEALTELLYWQGYWRSKKVSKVYSHMVGSYNSGYRSIDSADGELYAKDIIYRIKAIKLYLKWLIVH